MDLKHYLIDIVKILNGKGSESWPLSTFDVYFHDHVLSSEFKFVDNIFKWVILMIGCLFWAFVEASWVKEVIIIIGCADRRSIVGAVELIVGHFLSGGEFTAEVISSFDSEVEEGLRLVDVVYADGIAAIVSVS